MGVTAYLRRDDELSHYYSGNKYYKLFYNLRNAVQQDAKVIVSYGGVYSNHLYALAAAGKELNIPTIGIVRGYKSAALTPTLADATACGMRLCFLSKKDYRVKNAAQVLPMLIEYQNYYLIPEGAENLAGSRGCMAISAALAEQVPGDYTVCCPVGTGSTLAGLVAGADTDTHRSIRHLGFSVLKGEDKLSTKIRRQLVLLGKNNNDWQLITGFHHGGYGKVSAAMLAFMSLFEKRNNVLLEPVYTAKMLWGIEALAAKGFWPKGSIIIAIHTGGLQGRRGFEASLKPDSVKNSFSPF